MQRKIKLYNPDVIILCQGDVFMSRGRFDCHQMKENGILEKSDKIIHYIHKSTGAGTRQLSVIMGVRLCYIAFGVC